MLAPFELTHAASGQAEIDRIDAWLKQNMQNTWRMEFLGIAGELSAGPSRKGLVVRYRFGELADLERFREALRDGSAPAASTDARIAGKGRPKEGARVLPLSPRLRGSPRPAGGTVHRAAPDPAEASAFISRAAGALAGRRDGGSASGLYSISLERLCDNFGERWQQIEGRASDLVRAAIEKHLSEGDAFTEAKSHSYLLFLADAAPEISRRKVMRSAKEIARLLVGEDDPAQIMTIRAASLKPNGEFVFEEIGFEEAGESEPPPPEEPASSNEITPMLFSQPTLKDVVVRYCPVWDVRNGAVITHRCMGAVPRPSGSLATRESDIREIRDMHKAETVLQLDRIVLSRAIADVAKSYAEGLKSYLTLPIHFESLATTHRRLELLATLRQIPHEVANCLSYEIVDLPIGAPQGRIMDLVSPLLRMGRAVAARLPLTTESVRHLANTGIQTIGVDLENQHIPEFRLFREMDRFASLARRQGFLPYALGLRSLSLIAGAVGAGFTYVSGEPIAGISETIERPYRFSVVNLYDGLARVA